MESGNSGSFQSSTGDEEFDSHGDGISALNNLAAAHVGSFSNQQLQPPPPPLSCNTVSSYMYDHRQPPQQPPQPLENYQRSFMNSYVLDWSNDDPQRSETNPTELFNPMYRHGSAPSQPPSMAENTRVVPLQEPPPPPPPTTQEPKRPRKRSRASRGAATTVLTTDTTNFRAMVQEFTGIPEPPFPSHHFQKSRLDNIFGTVSGITSPALYLRRPFPQKVNLPFSSSSSFLGSSSSSNTNNMNISATTNALTSSLNNNYQFTPQSSSFFNLQNQFVPSFLKTHQESRDFSSSNDDFGGRVNNTSMLNPSTGFPGLISSDQRTSTNNNQTAVRWGNGTASTQDDDQSHVITSAANSNFSFSSS